MQRKAKPLTCFCLLSREQSKVYPFFCLNSFFFIKKQSKSLNLGEDELIVNIACNSFIFWMVLTSFYSATKMKQTQWRGGRWYDSMLSVTPSSQLHMCLHSRWRKLMESFLESLLFCRLVEGICWCSIYSMCLMKWNIYVEILQSIAVIITWLSKALRPGQSFILWDTGSSIQQNLNLVHVNKSLF